MYDEKGRNAYSIVFLGIFFISSLLFRVFCLITYNRTSGTMHIRTLIQQQKVEQRPESCFNRVIIASTEFNCEQANIINSLLA